MYIDHCFERIRQVRLVKQVIVMNENGHPIRSTIANTEDATTAAGLYASLKDKACYNLKTIDADDEFVMLRIKTRNNEAIISTDPDHGLMYITVQVPDQRMRLPAAALVQFGKRFSYPVQLKFDCSEKLV
uniref:Roadblock/LAMTOR2 domain-containing protein n=1 Tax=Anopheles merus TaxID=30066 RepID=A0A182VI85_ANOME